MNHPNSIEKETNRIPHMEDFEKYEDFCRNLGRKWRVRLLCILAYHQELRYSELKGLLAPITHKMLSEELSKLAEEGFILRKECGGVPVRVTYSLSELGKEFIHSFCNVTEWIDTNLP